MPKKYKSVGTFLVKRNLTFHQENDYIEAGRVVSAEDLHGKAESLLAAGLIEEIMAVEADEEIQEVQE